MNDGFENVSESGKSDLGLCRQNRSIRQKRSPATVHNRKSLPNFRIWGHDFLKDRAQHGKTCKPRKGQSPTPGKHARHRRARGPHNKTSAPQKRPSFKSQKARELPKSPIELKRHIRSEKGAVHSRKHAIKNDAPFITQTKKWVAVDADASIRHILCSISSTLEKSVRMTVQKNWTPACASVQNQVLRPPSLRYPHLE